MSGHDGLAGFAIVEPAPAKINLALHVVGQREDGYHLLETLVTFCAFGDRLGVMAAEEDQFTISGPFAGALGESDAGNNLVIRARDLLRQRLASRAMAAPPLHLHLEKNLPVSSGIGGGSADAAAVLRALPRFWRAPIAEGDLMDMAAQLGADVPMCVASTPLLARGIGEELLPLRDFPALSLVLVNPLVSVSTPLVFRLLTSKANDPLVLPDSPRTRVEWPFILEGMRNDLEPPARVLVPEIGEAAALLEESGASLVRMSGSGATCFGIYGPRSDAVKAQETLSRLRPDWFVAATETLAGSP
ncbi:4-(cytidine 5'-diphospho)-2-C-methyl-D-erythritol kinase [Sinorhizobium sp. BG8]|uniref:4-(cytidine 5'-diphospho)-2-C-methyl-D-erythritol kinase n=1 Tax=Sinorhizobium sp. BG8 TaxID=2613773 RepID=UPI00193E17CC|nr:4-(cytidine 5'-diphospho)-2-C-methyl-D-erythritol kinase [Sinorhizobium sp. BG8]QRM54507.1 4-(cytidine 5'-diphospho)-2-C-methyl-D-erythritol kinase [Sinorhizobium sp. BG8]